MLTHRADLYALIFWRKTMGNSNHSSNVEVKATIATLMDIKQLPQQPANAPAMLTELKHADAIIKAMLNAMTGRQKVKVHEQLDQAGVSNEGMTRHHERAAVIEAASTQAGAFSQIASDDVREVLDAVLDGTVDMDIAVKGIRQLTGLALEKCTEFGNATAVNALIRAALRHADDIENHVRWERTCVRKQVDGLKAAAASQIVGAA